MPGCCGVNDRSFTSRSPCCAGLIVRTHRGFITEEYFTFLFTSKLLNGRKILCHPFDNQKFIMLKSPALRPLGAESKLLKQTAHRDFAQTDDKLSSDQFSNHASRPQGKYKIQLSRALINTKADQRRLFSGECFCYQFAIICHYPQWPCPAINERINTFNQSINLLQLMAGKFPRSTT